MTGRLTPPLAVHLILWPTLGALNLVDAVFRGGRYAAVSIGAALGTGLVAAALIRRGTAHRTARTFSTRVGKSTRATVGGRS